MCCCHRVSGTSRGERTSDDMFWAFELESVTACKGEEEVLLPPYTQFEVSAPPRPEHVVQASQSPFEIRLSLNFGCGVSLHAVY